MTKPANPKTSTTAPEASTPPLPKTWDDIQIGSVVIGHESHEDGWWEAVVTEIRGDLLTLRWRDYPKQLPVSRNRRDVALLFPGE